MVSLGILLAFRKRKRLQQDFIRKPVVQPAMIVNYFLYNP